GFLLQCVSPLVADFVVEVGLEGRVGWADDFLRPAFRASPIRGGRSDALEALTLQTERHAHATHAADVIGGGGATSLASRLRFCAIAASVNSNCAPLGPRRRNRSSRRMRLRCANSISIFLRSRRDCANALVLARARATSRAASFTSRTIRRAGMFGQHFALSGHARHSGKDARYRSA